MSGITETVDWSKWDSKEDNFAKYSHVKSELIYGKLPEEKPDVSIMIPTFRRADLLKEAIDSALAQKTKYSFTITVVDNDAEVDHATDELMRQYCAENVTIIYYRNKDNIGAYGNWNRCIELSQADWLCLLHDDDMLFENYVETLFSLQVGHNVGMIITMSHIINTSANKRLSFHEKVYSLIGRIMQTPTLKSWNWDIDCMFNPTCMLLNRKLCIETGGFDNSFYPSSDCIFAMKMSYFHEVIFFNKQLSIRRIESNLSFDSCAQKGTLEICYKAGMEYFHKKNYSDKQSLKKATYMTLGAYLGMKYKSPTDICNFLQNDLGINGIYGNRIFQKLFYVWYLWRKFLETV